MNIPQNFEYDFDSVLVHGQAYDFTEAEFLDWLRADGHINEVNEDGEAVIWYDEFRRDGNGEFDNYGGSEVVDLDTLKVNLTRADWYKFSLWLGSDQQVKEISLQTAVAA